MNRSESKYFNTAVRMDEALLSLLEEKDLDYITVKEVCAVAGVNRSTFYLHYQGIPDLLAESLEHLDAGFSSYFPQGSRGVRGKTGTARLEDLYLITPDYIVPYLNYIKDHRRLYAAALARPESLDSHRRYERMYQGILVPILDRFGVPEPEREYLVAFYIEGIMAVVKHWLSRGCSDEVEFVAGLIMDHVLSPRDVAPHG